MGHSQAEKAESHRIILKLASQQVRAAGFASVSVANLMRAAGLTHGGFYGHFASRDELITQAFETALRAGAGDAVKPGEAALWSASAPSLRAWVRAYLSRSHRDQPATGCALAALAGEISREDRRMRSSFTGGLRVFLAGMARLMGGDGAGARRLGLAAASTMIGALILARAVDDEALSDEILMAAKHSILAQEQT